MSFEFFDLPSELRDIIYNYVRIYRFQEAKKQLSLRLEARKSKIEYDTKSDAQDGSKSYIVRLKINPYKTIEITKYIGSFVNIMVYEHEEKIKLYMKLEENEYKFKLCNNITKIWLYMNLKDDQFNRVNYDRLNYYDYNKNESKYYFASRI
jgi:hypothetical protein